MIKAVLFDLDGTLLPMDQDAFVKIYFKSLVTFLAPHGYEPQKLISGIWSGTDDMINNDGTCVNEVRFWNKFTELFGERVNGDKDKFEAFYRTDFDKAKAVCGFNGKAKQTVTLLKDMGVKVALATNPIFPAIATKKRMAWAGLEPSDFELYTTYENIGYCKPNLEYYRDVLAKVGCSAQDALMVGNDVSDDMVASRLGMRVFLLTDCLINKDNEDISKYPSGSFDELVDYIMHNK